MEAKLLNHSEENLWTEFVQNHPQGDIHQLPEWGRLGEKYWIIALFENGKIIGGTLLTRRSLPKGYGWFYAPRGPLLSAASHQTNETQSQLEMDALLQAIKPLAKQEKAIFLRIDPYTKIQSKNFKEVLYGFQPQHTLVLDISQTEDQILAQMKPKGRYNIRLAEKKGVTIRQSTPETLETDIDAYCKILTETTSRDNFRAHPPEFYKKMFAALGEKARLYLAYPPKNPLESTISTDPIIPVKPVTGDNSPAKMTEHNHPIAGIITTYFKDTATYYFGASSNYNRELMAPYLLHWQAIKDAKSAGYTKYDFFGIAPLDSPHHPWAGVTQFKEKFGGERIEHPPAFELPFKPLFYKLYQLYKNKKM